MIKYKITGTVGFNEAEYEDRREAAISADAVSAVFSDTLIGNDFGAWTWEFKAVEMVDSESFHDNDELLKEAERSVRREIIELLYFETDNTTVKLLIINRIAELEALLKSWGSGA